MLLRNHYFYFVVCIGTNKNILTHLPCSGMTHKVQTVQGERVLLKLGIWRVFPSILACEDKPPLCVACQFGQAHCHPWHKKGKASDSICKPNEVQPGDGTSVYQIVSAQPGLIPQMAGFPTSNRIWGTTIFCNHVSNFVYVHLMQNFTLVETLLAKHAYEGSSASWTYGQALPCR